MTTELHDGPQNSSSRKAQPHAHVQDRIHSEGSTPIPGPRCPIRVFSPSPTGLSMDICAGLQQDKSWPCSSEEPCLKQLGTVPGRGRCVGAGKHKAGKCGSTGKSQHFFFLLLFFPFYYCWGFFCSSFLFFLEGAWERKRLFGADLDGSRPLSEEITRHSPSTTAQPWWETSLCSSGGAQTSKPTLLRAGMTQGRGAWGPPAVPQLQAASPPRSCLFEAILGVSRN